MATNQVDCSSLPQRFIISLLPAKKCNHTEEYEMCKGKLILIRKYLQMG